MSMEMTVFTEYVNESHHQGTEISRSDFMMYCNGMIRFIDEGNHSIFPKQDYELAYSRVRKMTSVHFMNEVNCYLKGVWS